MLRNAVLVCGLTSLLIGCGSGGGPLGQAGAVTIRSVTPTSGFTPGGDLVVVTGSGFLAIDAGSTTVTIDGRPVAALVVESDTRLTFRTPGGQTGPADVRVAGAGTDAVMPDGFTYYRMPAAFLGDDVRLSTDPAADRASGTKRCCAGDRVHVVWSDDRDGERDIFVRTSFDRGLTWPDPDRRLDPGDAGAATSNRPAICCDGERVFVVWQDELNGAADIYFARSLDGGRTWDPQVRRLDTDTAGASLSWYPRICCAGGNVYAVWRDDRSGIRDVHFRRSPDAGATWGPDIRVPRNVVATAHAEGAELCCDGASVYVVWVDCRNGSEDIYFNRSLDGGTTWLTVDRRLDTDTAGAACSEEPRICCADGTLYVVWDDLRDGLEDIYFNRSSNGGESWLPADIPLETDVQAGSDSSLEHSICCLGERFYVVWPETLQGAEREIRFSASSDRGQSFGVSDKLLTQIGLEPRLPEICCTGAHVYVTYVDTRDGQRDLYFDHTSDGGTTWQASATRLDTDLAGAALSQFQSLCCDGARVHVAWEDGRGVGGAEEIRYQRSIP